MTFCDQLKVRLTGLEEHFDLPALPVDPNDLFFRKIRSCTDERNPVFLVLFVAYTYDLCRDLMILPNHDVYRKKILAATSALLTDAESDADGFLIEFSKKQPASSMGSILPPVFRQPIYSVSDDS